MNSTEATWGITSVAYKIRINSKERNWSPLITDILAHCASVIVYDTRRILECLICNDSIYGILF